MIRVHVQVNTPKIFNSFGLTLLLLGGFVDGRFLTGIRPQEYFFHCMAGREVCCSDL